MAERERSTPGRAALVANPIKADVPMLTRTLKRLSKLHGWRSPLVLETTVDDAGQDATRRALDDGATAVLVAGGDGTVRAVAEAMRGTGVPLTIVPSGTGNLLARNLGLPLTSPATMIETTFAGEQRAIDIGVATVTRDDGTRTEHAFVVLAGIGLDAAMIANTRSDLKKTVGWVAYVDGAARSLTTAKPFRVMYQQAGHRLHTTKVQSVLFANCGQLPAGIALIPDAAIADGQMDIMIIQPRGPFGWLFVWRTVWWHNSVLRRTKAGRRVLQRRAGDSSIRYLQGDEMELATSPGQPIELDGDEFGAAARLNCRIDGGALVVTVPAGHPPTR